MAASEAGERQEPLSSQPPSMWVVWRRNLPRQLLHLRPAVDKPWHLDQQQPAPPLFRRRRLQRRTIEILALAVVCGAGACGLLGTASWWGCSSPALFRTESNNPRLRLDDGGDHRYNNTGSTDDDSTTPRISYTLHQGLGMNFRFTQKYRCAVNPRSRRALPDEMHQKPGLFDFFPRITTDLRILFAGDSVAIQMAQAMEEAVGSQNERRSIYAQYRKDADAVYATAPVRGGGAVAGYRLFHFFRPHNEEGVAAVGAPQPPASRRRQRRLSFTWSRDRVQALLNHTYSPDGGRNGTTTTATISAFDVVVQRISHGWHGLEDITEDALRDSSKMLHGLFGTRTIVLLNLPFVNNVEEPDQYRVLVEKRQVVRDFANNYVSPEDGSGVRSVLVLEQGEWLDRLYEWNARTLGYDTSKGVNDWMFGHRLAKYKPTSGLTRKIAHHCSESVPDNSTNGCLRNSLTEDGMHPCLSTLGGRMLSGIACLIACAHNYPSPDDSMALDRLRKCEAECNGRFMSLEPIPPSDFVPWNVSAAAR